METLVENHTPDQATVTTANAMGRLSQAAKTVNQIAMNRRLHQMLKGKKIGLYQTEVQSLGILQGTRSYEQVGDNQKGKVKIKKLQEIREHEQVGDGQKGKVKIKKLQ